MFDPNEVLTTMLDQAGPGWRVIWEELPTDQIFDNLYSIAGKYEAFMYQGALFERQGVDLGIYVWEPTDGSNVVEWILDNPPFECCVVITDLYRYAENMQADYSPWLLFLELVYGNVEGRCTTPVPIGGNDGVFIGQSLVVWGEYADVIDPYIKLILAYTGQ